MSEEGSAGARQSPPGFRFSLRDACVIALCALTTWWLWGTLGSIAILLPGVLLHFFLFCNVFRVRTRYELIWAALFLLNASAWQIAHELSWQGLLGSQLAVSVLVIGAELRSPTYCGVGHRRIGLARAPAGESSR